MDRLSIYVPLIRIRRSLRKRRFDAKGQYTEEPDSWITLKSNGEHVPLNSAGVAIGGAGGWANGKDFSGAKRTKKGHNKAKEGKLDKAVGTSKEFKANLEMAEKTIRNNKFESAYCIDKDGNKLFHESQGEAHFVKFTPEQVESMRDSCLTHNHPSGNTFSPEDINLILHSGAAMIRACSEKTDYELARLEGDFPEREYFVKDYVAKMNADKEVLDKIYERICNDYESSKISYNEYSEQVDQLNVRQASGWDKWLSENAHKYGYRYTVTRR